MKESKTKIKNIEIEIGDVSINLNLEQAKELKNILNDLFKQTTPTYIPYPSWPHIEDSTRIRPRDVWCTTSSRSEGTYVIKESK